MSRCLHYLHFLARIRSASTLSHLRTVCAICMSPSLSNANFYSCVQLHGVSFVGGSFLRTIVRTKPHVRLFHVRNDLTEGDCGNVVAMVNMAVRGSNPVGRRVLSCLFRPALRQTQPPVMGTRSFLGVKRTGRGADQPHLYSSEVANGAELYLRLPSVPA